MPSTFVVTGMAGVFGSGVPLFTSTCWMLRLMAWPSVESVPDSYVPLPLSSQKTRPMMLVSRGVEPMGASNFMKTKFEASTPSQRMHQRPGLASRFVLLSAYFWNRPEASLCAAGSDAC